MGALFTSVIECLLICLSAFFEETEIERWTRLNAERAVKNF